MSEKESSSEETNGRAYAQVYYVPTSDKPEKVFRINITFPIPTDPSDTVSAAHVVTQAEFFAQSLVESNFTSIPPAEAAKASAVLGIDPEEERASEVTHLLRSKTVDGRNIIDFYNPSVMPFKMVRMWIGDGQEDRMDVVEAMTGLPFQDIQVVRVSQKGDQIELINGTYEGIVKLNKTYTAVGRLLRGDDGQPVLYHGNKVYPYSRILGLNQDSENTEDAELSNLHTPAIEKKKAGEVDSDINPYPEFGSIFKLGISSTFIMQEVVKTLQKKYDDTEMLTEDFVRETLQSLNFNGWAGNRVQRVSQAHLVEEVYRMLSEFEGHLSEEEIEQKAASLVSEINATKLSG